jgi:hypothetical protein
MNNCIICGSKTKYPLFDFCEECFNTSIEELDKKYGRERASQTSEDHEKAQPAEDSFKSCQPKSFYHTLERVVKRIFA